MKSIYFPPPTADDAVRATLNGTKTVTRRVVKMPDTITAETVDRVRMKNGLAHFSWSWGEAFAGFDVKPPYLPGDILYVRETFFEYKGHYYYKADGKHEALAQLGIAFKWHPSIHMPREAARIFLRVTDVRVEQLYYITGKQARAEGFLSRDAFIRAFLTMYPDCTVKSWVWPIEFERCEKPEGG